MYFLDTNVVSELRRAPVAWLESAREEDLHLSAVTIGEIQAGVEITREQDQAKAAEIEAWLEQVAETYNVLSMDARTFRSWARLVHRKPDRLVEGAKIAATATVHGLTAVTHNVRHFDRLGVAAFNPFDGKLS
jgi:predicted nucleic acid-binding protein